MKLNIYKNQKEIEKTYTVDAYDLMYGTVQDILAILDAVDLQNMNDTSKILDAIKDNRTKVEDLLLDIFGSAGLTPDELRRMKIKELIPLFMDLFAYVKKSFEEKN